MILSDEIKNNIQEALDMLNAEERATLDMVVTLCANIEEGVTQRDLTLVLPVDTMLFIQQMRYICQCGLILSYDNLLFCPKEVSSYLKCVISADVKNLLIGKLAELTSISFTNDLMKVAPFFNMGYNLLAYCVEHPENIEYSSQFSTLVINLANHYDVFAKIDSTLFSVEELIIMRALEISKSHIQKDSLTMAMLETATANIFIAGFHYQKARPILDHAFEVLKLYPDAKKEYSYICLIAAYYWKNYGVGARCLAYLWKSYETGDKSTKDYVSILLTYEMALLDEMEISTEWFNKVDVKKYPRHSVITFYSYLIDALKQTDYSSAEHALIMADYIVSEVNPDACMRASVNCVKYLILSKCQMREANVEYRLYSQRIAKSLYSSPGAALVYYASEVLRHIGTGNMLAAKRIVLEVLDLADLTSEEWALSVRMSVLYAYVCYNKASGLDVLVDARCEQAIEILEKMGLQDQDTLAILHQIFGENIPDVVARDSLWFFEYTKLKNSINDITTITEAERLIVKEQIKHLTETFPEKKNLLDALNIILDMEDDILSTHIELNNIIDATASDAEKYELCCECGRSLSSFVFDAAYFFSRAMNTDYYKTMNSGQKVETMLEFVPILHECGRRGLAYNLYEEMAMLAEGTELLSKVYQSWALCYYSVELWGCCKTTLQNAINAYEREESVWDETLSSLYTYYSVVLSAEADYEEALKAIKLAQRYYPISEDKEGGFALLFNEAFFLAALNNDTEAKEALAKARNYASSDEERNMVSELESIMRKKPEYRAEYFKQISQDSETDNNMLN